MFNLDRITNGAYLFSEYCKRTQITVVLVGAPALIDLFLY